MANLRSNSRSEQIYSRHVFSSRSILVMQILTMSVTFLMVVLLGDRGSRRVTRCALKHVDLLPTGSGEREVLGVAILRSWQNMKIIALQLHNMNIVG